MKRPRNFWIAWCTFGAAWSFYRMVTLVDSWWWFFWFVLGIANLSLVLDEIAPEEA